jgi:phosphoribosyl 1,2-cyclic phosphate phosphodiesterase
MRSSALVRHRGRALLIDVSPEFRLQCLACGVERVDAVLLTHAHADHILGMDDLVRFNVLQGAAIPVHGAPESIAHVRSAFAYAFRPPHPGGYRPSFDLHPVDGPFNAAGLRVLPLPAHHGELPVLGYRIGPVAYLTDVSHIPPETLALLERLRILVLGALRPRPHPTHFSIDEALAAARTVGAEQTFLTHLSHETDHAAAGRGLPGNVALAWDGLRARCPDH